MSEARDPGDAPSAPAVPSIAGLDRGDRVHEFRGEGVSVTWSRRRCIHAGACVMNLPAVFEPGRRPWIELAEAPADSIARVVEHCPTGALHFQRTDGGAPEAAPATNIALVTRNGPLYVHGAIELVDESGAPRLSDTRIALCRCGRSANKPLCDGTHGAAGFSDPGEVSAGTQVKDSGARSGRLRVRPLPDGPLEIDGAFVLLSADHQSMVEGTAARLCRCGQSQSKPFCDGSHLRSGFPSA